MEDLREKKVVAGCVIVEGRVGDGLLVMDAACLCKTSKDRLWTDI